jgi:transposase InsO family protein
MPWKTSPQQQRLHFVCLAVQAKVNFRQLCHHFGISAPTGYKWLARYRARGATGLQELSRKPKRSPQKYRALWKKELFALRRQHPRWGVKKLRIRLQAQHPRARKLPSLRALGRWLQAAHLTRPPAPRHRRGPQVPWPALTPARRCNDGWTIDFKGWFRTQDGHRCDPLTMRDLASRFLLALRILPEQSDACVRRVMTGVFKTGGLPRIIRVDNGSPFAGQGSALQLSTLSVWWLRLGIRVEFTRPAKPQDNGAHEQMHRVLKAETASPPAANPHAQQRRLDRWQNQYNRLRPHEALGGRVPANLYTRSPRPFHQPTAPTYPATWLVRRVRPNGWIKFQGVLRFIGRAFARQTVGLQPAASQSWNVYLQRFLIGTLHHADGAASMRITSYYTPQSVHSKSKPLSPANHANCKPCRAPKV